MLAPRQPESHHVDENDDCHLGQDRVAQADGRGEGLVEPRPRVLGDEPALPELAGDESQSLVHDQLGADEQGNHQEEACLRLDITQKRD